MSDSTAGPTYDPTKHVLLDPDNEEQMKRLSAAYWDALKTVVTGATNVMIEAVRSMREPAEPEGLGAIIVDGNGVALFKRRLLSGGLAWSRLDHIESYCYWRDIPRPIRVIRQGLTEEELGR